MIDGRVKPEGVTKVTRRLGGLVTVVLALAAMALTFGSHAAPVSATVRYSTVPVLDGDLDGNPNTGAWSDAGNWTVPLENGASSPYGSATLYAKHDGTYVYFRIDGSIDVPWTSAGGNHFWLGIQWSTSNSAHHGGGTWDGVFFGLWDGVDYTPQPSYPPWPVDTGGFSRPPAKDTSQDALGATRYSGGSAPYGFTAEWKKKLNTGDASDIAYAADGTTTYYFYVTTDSNGKGSSGGIINHNAGTVNLNTMTFAPPSAPNTPPQVDLTSPDGGEVWSGGSSHSIRWNMSDSETPTTSLKVWINYSSDGGLTYAPIAGAQGLSGLSNPCSFLWTLPTTTTAQARVMVTVLDAKSAAASDSSLANFVVDATAPTVAAFSPSDGATGVSPTTQVRVSFSESMNKNSAEQSFSLKRLDSGAYVTGTFSWLGNDLIFTPASAFAGGIVHRAQVNATAKDASDPGNPLGIVYAASFTTADTSPPTISGVSASPSPQEAGGRVNVSAIVTDNGMISGVWIEVRDPGGALIGNFTAGYDLASGRYFHEAVYAHPGTYGFRVAAQDAAGNWKVVTGTFVIVDTTSPAIQHVPVSQALIDSPIRISALITDVDAVSDARVDYTDVLGVHSNVSMTLVGGLYAFDIPGQPQLGTLTYFVWTTDPSGNAARTPQFTVTVVGTDTTPPSISNLAAVPAIQDAGLSVNISATVSDNIAVQSVSVLISDPQGPVLGNFSMLRLGASDTFYYERTYASLGVHGFVLWATDESSNAASASSSFEIVDRLAPVFRWVSITPAVSEAGQPVNISAGVTDNLAVSSVSVRVRDATGGVLLDQAMAGSPPLYWSEATFRSLGDLTVVLSARDLAGNAATYSGALTIIDMQPPVAVAGADVEVWIGSVVTFDGSASHDNSAIVNFTWSFTYNGTDVVRYGPVTSFMFDAVGQYAVTLTVVDAAGLEGTSHMTVTVTTDTTPPPAPRNVLVVAIAPACLQVTWEPSAAADTAGYQIYRWNQTRTSFDLIAEVPANATSYTDCGLEDDTVYSYWVVALDQYGNLSPPSPIDNGRTTAPSVSLEDASWLYQTVIAILSVLAVIFAALWVGEKKRKTPPELKPR